MAGLTLLPRAPSNCLLALLTALIATGCGNKSSATPDAPLQGVDMALFDAGLHVTAHFVTPKATPVAFADVPFPSDLYLDSTGHVALASLPTGSGPCSSVTSLLQSALNGKDGFGLVAPMFFAIDKNGGTVNPSTASAAVRLFAVGATPGACTELKVDSEYRDDLAYVVTRLGPGVVLNERSKYAAVLTDALIDGSGTPVRPSSDFATLRGLTARPSDPAQAAAYDNLQAALACAAAASPAVTAAHVIDATTFTTESLQKDLQAIHAQVAALPPQKVTLSNTLMTATGPVAMNGGTIGTGTTVNPLGISISDVLGTPKPASDGSIHPGYDNPGGIIQSHIGWIVNGQFPEQSYTQPMAFQKGAFTYDSSGKPKVKSTIPLWFTLMLPNTTTSLANLPVVIYMHGITFNRTGLFPFADAFNALGIAVIGFDLPFHGARNSHSKDALREVTGVSGPDYVGDRIGIQAASDFLDLDGDPATGVQPLDPAVLRDNLRQAAVDAMELVQVLKTGDWSAVQASAPGLASLSFDPNHIGLTSESFGSTIGLDVLAEEPEIPFGEVSVPAGGLVVPALLDSPVFSPVFEGFLENAYGITAQIVDDDQSPMHGKWNPMANLFQWAIDEGDALSFAPIISSRINAGNLNLLVALAYSDEYVPNQSGEPLAAALGLPLVQTSETPAPPGPRYATLATMKAPYSGNAGGGKVTSGVTETAPSTHGVLAFRYGADHYNPGFPPFKPIVLPDGGTSTSIGVTNPIDQMQKMWAAFASSWVAGAGAPTIIDSFP